MIDFSIPPNLLGSSPDRPMGSSLTALDSGGSLLTDLESLPGTDVRDLGPGDLTALRTYLNSNLFAFARLIFGYRDLIPTLHGDMSAWISLWGHVEVERNGVVHLLHFTEVSSTDKIVSDYRRVMTQIPREFFKTSLGTRANALWQLTIHPHLPIAIFNERLDNSKKWLGAIRSVVEGSKVFQTLYRDLLPPGVHYQDTRSMPRSWKWTDTEMDFEGKSLGECEYSISAHGIEGATTGGHWPKLILDDLISVKHKMSAVEMDRAREWVSNHIYLMRPAERSSVYINCTPWTYTDIYRDLLRDYGYKLYRRSALELPDGTPDVAKGESVFPQKLSTPKLREMYDRDPYSFKAQMMCIPSAGRESSFSMDWLRRGGCDPTTQEPEFWIDLPSYSPTVVGYHRGTEDNTPPRNVPLYMMRKEIIVDPAPSEPLDLRRNPNARTAMLVEGVDPWGRRFLLEAWAGRGDYMTVIAQLFTLADRWGARVAHVEEVNFSNVYRHWIRREQQPDGRWPGFGLIVRPLRPNKRDKHARILARQADWLTGLYYLNTSCCSQFMVEYAEYPNSETVDLMDCMGYDKDPGVLPRPETPDERLDREWNSTKRPWPHNEIDPITGYGITMRPTT